MPKRSQLPGRRPKAKRRTPPAGRELREAPQPVAVEELRPAPAVDRARPEVRPSAPVRDYSYVIKDLQRIALTMLVVTTVLVVAVIVLG